MAPRISVVVNTLNEEANLPLALGSVCPWVDEIVVVDMQSDDRTPEIARQLGAVVYPHERAGVVEAARNYAIAQATGEWILVLDADELIPEPLSRVLREIVREDACDVVVIPMLNYLLGSPLLHTGWGPEQDMHARFFRRGCMQASEVIHGGFQATPDARIRRLPYRPGEAIVHFNYVDGAHFIQKLNRYTTVEAQQSFGRGERSRPVRALLAAAREFVSRYLRHGGYRDGWRGFYLSAFMAFYRIAISAKLRELERTGGRERIREHYTEEARRLIGEYSGEAAGLDV